MYTYTTMIMNKFTRFFVAFALVFGFLLSPTVMNSVDAKTHRPELLKYYRNNGIKVMHRLEVETVKPIDLKGIRFIAFETKRISEDESWGMFASKVNEGSAFWLYKPEYDGTGDFYYWFVPKEDDPKKTAADVDNFYRNLHIGVLTGDETDNPDGDTDITRIEKYQFVDAFMWSHYPELLEEALKLNIEVDKKIAERKAQLKKEEAEKAAMAERQKLLNKLDKPVADYIDKVEGFSWSDFGGRYDNLGDLDVNWLINNLWYMDASLRRSDIKRLDDFGLKSTYAINHQIEYDINEPNKLHEWHGLLRIQPIMNLSILDIDGNPTMGNTLITNYIAYNHDLNSNPNLGAPIKLQYCPSKIPNNPNGISSFLFQESQFLDEIDPHGTYYVNNEGQSGWHTVMSSNMFVFEPQFDSATPDTITLREVWFLADDRSLWDGEAIYTGFEIKLTRVIR